MSNFESFGIGGGLISGRTADSVLEEAVKIAEDLNVEILLMDADMVFGKIHIESAVEHAARAFENETNTATSRMMEVMLYASGERQLSTAIKKMGIKDKTERIAVIVSDSKKLEEVMDSLDIRRDDTVLEGKVENLPAFGITEKEISSVQKERVLDLVLERVALVDLIK